MGPVGAKTYAARRVKPAGERAKVTPDYDRRGSVWVYGALEPSTGEVFTQMHEHRDSACFGAFLDALELQWPTGEIMIILDNLSTHRTQDILLWLHAHPRVRFLFLPTYSPWLNLIEPWWKTLRSLALKGRSFENPAAVITALTAATCYWNAHRKPYRWRRAY